MNHLILTKNYIAVACFWGISTGCVPGQDSNTTPTAVRGTPAAVVKQSAIKSAIESVTEQLQLNTETRASLQQMINRDPFSLIEPQIEQTQQLTKSLEMLAEKGHPRCQVILAKKYYKDLMLANYTRKDSGEMHVESFFNSEIADQLSKTLKVATSYMIDAEKSGESCAKHLLARYLIEENWTRDTREQGLNMLLQNANDHYLPSMLLIGELSLEGRYVAHDFAKAIEWFQIAANKSAEAEVPLAKAFLSSEDPRAKQRGIDRLLALSKDGDPYAMIAIGNYCSSERSKKSILSGNEPYDEIKNEALRRRKLLDESCYWYGEAAKQNITEAIFNLAGVSRVRELMMEMDKQGEEISTSLQNRYSPVELHLRASRDVLLDAMGAEGEQYQENARQMKTYGP